MMKQILNDYDYQLYQIKSLLDKTENVTDESLKKINENIEDNIGDNIEDNIENVPIVRFHIIR